MKTSLKKWWAFVEQNEPWKSSPSQQDAKRLARAIDRFRQPRKKPSEPTENQIVPIVNALAKGAQLLQTAREWKEPRVGTGSKVRQEARGLQWRTVMAYGGLETILKSCCGIDGPGLDGRVVATLCDGCLKDALAEYTALDPPRFGTRSSEKWLGTTEDAADPALLSFLRIKQGDAKAVRKWLVDGQPVTTWSGAIMLAKALRNATAHGALSASKVVEWKLAPTLDRLTSDHAVVAAGVLNVLCEE